MKEFLNKVSKKYQKNIGPKVLRFENDFKNATNLINSKLRAKPFSVRGPLNTSLFDSVFCVILNNINRIPDDINDRYERLLVDQDFIDHTTLATTDAKIVKERFVIVKQYLID